MARLFQWRPRIAPAIRLNFCKRGLSSVSVELARCGEHDKPALRAMSTCPSGPYSAMALS